jgi:hypothetical protein
VADVCFEKLLGGTTEWEKGGGGRRGCVRVEAEEGGEGGLASQSAARCGRQRTTAVGRGSHRCCVNRGATVVGDMSTWVKVADEQDRHEAGPGGSGRGA